MLALEYMLSLLHGDEVFRMRSVIGLMCQLSGMMVT